MDLDKNGHPDYGETGPIGPYFEVLVEDWEEMMDALALAISEADGWYDDCNGGPIPGEDMERARALIAWRAGK